MSGVRGRRFGRSGVGWLEAMDVESREDMPEVVAETQEVQRYSTCLAAVDEKKRQIATEMQALADRMRELEDERRELELGELLAAPREDRVL